jgi:hypothetical protein
MAGEDMAGKLGGALGDEEGARVPASLPPVVDAHVHLFPDPVFAAVWRWFDEHGWPVRYKLSTPALIEFLLSRGLQHLVALQYAHKPGIARGLNAYLAQICRAEPRVTGLATVHPAEPQAGRILDEAFQAGLGGVKIHCHVQCVAPDGPEMEAVYAACVAHDLPLVMHAGREPRSEAYPCDPHRLCGAHRVEAVLEAYPKLRLCVPHLGADEYEAYLGLLERYDNLWLDTTMMLAGYFAAVPPRRILEARPDRVMYGSDFPNLPYAWDRELRRLADLGFGDETLAWITGGTARSFFGIGSGR